MMARHVPWFVKPDTACWQRKRQFLTREGLEEHFGEMEGGAREEICGWEGFGAMALIDGMFTTGVGRGLSVKKLYAIVGVGRDEIGGKGVGGRGQGGPISVGI